MFRFEGHRNASNRDTAKLLPRLLLQPSYDTHYIEKWLEGGTAFFTCHVRTFMFNYDLQSSFENNVQSWFCYVSARNRDNNCTHLVQQMIHLSVYSTTGVGNIWHIRHMMASQEILDAIPIHWKYIIHLNYEFIL
jgi:hypothetical protein